MTKKLPPPNEIIEAGSFLKSIVERELVNGAPNTEIQLKALDKVRELHEAGMTAAKTDRLRRKGHAIQQAIQALENEENGRSHTVETSLFDAFVESHEGGPRALDLGGRGPVKHKKTVKEYALRAALLVLWEAYPNQRTQLAAEAYKYLDIRNASAVAKMVENHEQSERRLPYSSPLTRHIDSARALQQKHGYRSVKDFL